MSRVYYPQARAILQVVFDGFGETAADSPRKIIPVLPKEVVIHRNSYKQADSWELVFDGRDLPIDPQLIRAGAAEIYLFQVPGITDDQRVISRQVPEALEQTRPGQAQDAVGQIAQELGVPSTRDRFVFGNRPIVAGLFDDVSLEYTSRGKQVVVSGQDYTSYLISRQWPPTKGGRPRRIPTGERLDLLLKRILKEADPEGQLALSVENLDPTTLPRVGSTEVRGNKRGIPVEQETSYWDVMYKVATRYGCILFVRGLDVVLTRPQNLESGYQNHIRTMAWGKNIESLQMTRHLGKEKVPRIIVQSYDPDTRKKITVEYPVKPEEVPHGTVGVVEDEYQLYPVHGIKDPKILAQAAESLFHLLGKGERRVRVRTRDLTDLAEKNSLIDTGSGDAVQVEWRDFNRELLANPELPVATKYEHLMARGFNASVAMEIAKNFAKLEGLTRPLRIREATIEYSASDGISVEMEMVDFVVVDGTRNSANKTPRKKKVGARNASGKEVGSR